MFSTIRNSACAKRAAILLAISVAWTAASAVGGGAVVATRPQPQASVIDVQSAIDPAEARRHWAFRPPKRPPVPEPNGHGLLRESSLNSRSEFSTLPRGWARTPLDRFVLAKLQQNGLHPVGPAGKRTLIRRATFDLLGLPPTPEEIDEFLADDSPAAFARLIDRLLASPHYGERWGRHWLDVARYADSNGLDENVAHGNAWRYRDWVIAAFNADKPFDEFVIEQLAGDLLLEAEVRSRAKDAIPGPSSLIPHRSSGSPLTTHHSRTNRLIATGFLSLGPKVLAEVDERKMEMDIVDEQIDTIGRAFMGLTLGCARCHEHKFDPIDQRDYYSLAGIFRSTLTMDSFTKIARWHENTIASPQQIADKREHEKLVAEKKAAIDSLVKSANEKLIAERKPGFKLPKNPERLYPPETKAELKRLRDELARLEKAAPVLPTAMGVQDGEIAETAVLLRGDHLTPGEKVPRRFPVAIAGLRQRPVGKDTSGRLKLARWLTSPEHPLTARVIVNRVWRWHFGRGIVGTPDNFGRQGEPPVNQPLLDWLAVELVSPTPADELSSDTIVSPPAWSLKRLHRLIMLSATFRLSSRHDPENAARDPENRCQWRADVRRLEAEAIRDAMLAVAGLLNRRMGGSMLHVANREFIFNHTSKDETRYESDRRSVYLPVVRNHLYDVFTLFDYTDASVSTGDRPTTTTAPQALYAMNSDFVIRVGRRLAARTLKEGRSDGERVRRLYERAFGRPPGAEETKRALDFLQRFAGNDGAPTADNAGDSLTQNDAAWQALAQALLASNEFVYVR